LRILEEGFGGQEYLIKNPATISHKDFSLCRLATADGSTWDDSRENFLQLKFLYGTPYRGFGLKALKVLPKTQNSPV
jgi:hypothetical protein